MIDYKKELLLLLIAKRVCIATKECYMSLLWRYEGFCYSEGLLPEEMPHEGLLQFQSEATSESGAKQRKAFLTNLYEFVLGQGYKLHGLPNPIQRVRVPESLSPDEIERIFAAVPKTYEGKKQCLLLKILYACGLRVHEGVKVHKNDFRQKFNSRTGRNYFELRIIGKGKKQRLVPVPDETMNEILLHIKERNITGYLFEGQFAGHYSVKSVQNVFMKAKIACGITTPGNTHLLRKTRTTVLIDGQINDRTIMQMFGWKAQKTIDHYHRANTGAMKNAIDEIDEKIRNRNIMLNNNEQQLKQIAA